MFVALVEQQLQQELPECDGALHDDGEGAGTPKTQVICSQESDQEKQSIWNGLYSFAGGASVSLCTSVK